MGKTISSADQSRQDYKDLPQFQYALWQAQEKNAPVQFRYGDYQVTIQPDGTWAGEDKYGHFVRNSVLGLASVLGGGTLAGLAAGAGGAAGAAGAGTAGTGAAGAGGTLASTPISGMIAGSAVPTVVSGSGAAGTAATIAGATKTGLSTLGKIGTMLDAAGNTISGATEAAANRDMANEQAARGAYNSNVAANSAYETELMNRAVLEANQRAAARRDLYRDSYFSNPSRSPFNPTGGQQVSGGFLEALANLAKEGSNTLSTPATYNTQRMTPLEKPAPYTPNKIGDSTLQKVGNWVGPGASLFGKIASLF